MVVAVVALAEGQPTQQQEDSTAVAQVSNGDGYLDVGMPVP